MALYLLFGGQNGWFSVCYPADFGLENEDIGLKTAIFETLISIFQHLSLARPCLGVDGRADHPTLNGD